MEDVSAMWAAAPDTSAPEETLAAEAAAASAAWALVQLLEAKRAATPAQWVGAGAGAGPLGGGRRAQVTCREAPTSFSKTVAARPRAPAPAQGFNRIDVSAARIIEARRRRSRRPRSRQVVT